MFFKLLEFITKLLCPILNLRGRVNPLFAVPFLCNTNKSFTFARKFDNTRSQSRNRIRIFLNANNLRRTLSTQFAHCAIKVFKFVCAKCTFNLFTHIANFCFKFVDCGSLCFTFKRLRGFTHLRLQVDIFTFKLSNLRRVFFSRLIGFAVRLTIPFLSLTKKAFGTLIYRDTERHDYCYCIRSNTDSVEDSVG